jgi:hypothetical protein
LDNVGGRRVGPKVGPGRRKSKHNNPRPQAEAEDNEYHRASERNARYEKVASRVESSADAKVRKDMRRWNPFKKSNEDDRVVGGGEEEHGASTDIVRNNDPRGDHNASTRRHSRKRTSRSRQEEGNLQISSSLAEVVKGACTT